MLTMRYELILAIFFLSILLLSMTKRHALGGRRLSLVRSLFPSWRFFDQLENVPKIFYRLRLQNNDLTNWQPIPIHCERKFINLFSNPNGNLYFAFHSLTEQVISDMNDCTETSEFATSTSYELMKNMVHFLLMQKTGALFKDSTGFQFMISMNTIATQKSNDGILVSLEHSVELNSDELNSNGIKSEI